ncbi:hypothetical protein LB543_01340 [Mesorhizobium sp. ESP7-2]|uniref:hypothetical protein n=1 Tax=Mesorhizobium sp. ESP7-2 TaxID=2876622 RepID=UPI001CCAEE10|nr:hypothetical protein [Mesorhizobium sp. ESP7-2]MBZ9705372.1 hypothetical protein [Mesorhizobium sp. ESP7-2]
MTDPSRTLAHLEVDLQKAIENLKLADERESEASRSATSARNRVNDLQKLVELKLIEMRDKAPYNTDWSNSKRKGVSV